MHVVRLLTAHVLLEQLTDSALDGGQERAELVPVCAPPVPMVSGFSAANGVKLGDLGPPPVNELVDDEALGDSSSYVKGLSGETLIAATSPLGPDGRPPGQARRGNVIGLRPAPFAGKSSRRHAAVARQNARANSMGCLD